MFKFSLITTTRGRPKELLRLFESLRMQGEKNFEVILIDQNGDAATADAVTTFKSSFSITHIKTGLLTLSQARNLGLAAVKGELVAFPDDDCYYDKDVLSLVYQRMNSHHLGILSCRGFDPETKQELLSTLPKAQTPMKPGNIFGIGMSITLFFRASVIKDMKFDEKLGVGCEAGSGEETDFLIRAFRRGVSGMYFPEISIFHPYPAPVFDQAVRRRAYSYGLGFGIVLRRHFSLALFPHLLRSMIIRPLGGMVLSLFHPSKFLWCWTVFRSRWAGFIFGQ